MTDQNRLFQTFICIAIAVLNLNLAVAQEQIVEHIPMIQTSTSDREVGITMLGRRLVNYKLRASPIDKEGPPIESKLMGAPEQDPQKLLHDRVWKFQFTGLEPNTEYKLEVIETTKYGERVGDERVFKTFDNVPRPLKYSVISCMSDERRFAAPRKVLWEKVVESNPDFVALIGDHTYVDSFDVVTRGAATPLDVWIRYFDSFKSNPFYSSYKLVPTVHTWDDHDTGLDNGNKTTETLAEARRAFQALYGNHDIQGVLENGTEGVYRIFHLAGQHFVFMDNRSFRDLDTVDSEFGHYGKEQEEWFFKKLAEIKSGPVVIFDGGMWGAETVMANDPHTGAKRITESFYGDHPTQYRRFMQKLNDSGVTYVLVSGDIHLSQIIQHGPQFKGKSRYAPFSTVEITSSPIHSIIFRPKPGEPAWWPDLQRLVAVKDYNFVNVMTEWDGKTLDVSAVSIGMSPAPHFSFGTKVTRDSAYKSARRRFLRGGFDRTDKRVRVAFFDADETVRIAPSKSVSANSPEDVFILPGVANKIAELVEQGYLIALVSNQGGVAAGKVSFEVADQALRTTIRKIQEQNPKAKIHYYDMAERGHGDYFAKPNPGMGKQLEQALARMGYQVDWLRSFMVGDSQYGKNQIEPRTNMAGRDNSDVDRQFAIRLGIPYHHPREFFGWTESQRRAIQERRFDLLGGTVRCSMLLGL